jgi:uncharacterized membrane protein
VEPNKAVEREKAAVQFDKGARIAAFGVISFAAIAVIDFATGSLTNDRRIDTGFLAMAALSLSGVFQLRGLARTFRSDDFPPKATPTRWLAVVVSMVITLGFSGGIGYLVDGWALAIALPSITVVLTVFSIGLGLRRRRRAKTAS